MLTDTVNGAGTGDDDPVGGSDGGGADGGGAPRSGTALFVAAFDSQLKWCGRIRDEFAARGFACRVVVPDVRSALSPQQIRDAGFDRIDAMTWSDLLDAALTSDVVVCGLSGPITKALSVELADRRRVAGVLGPVLITGWVGVIIEKITAGYLDRCGSDIVAVNSVGDLDHFSGVAARLGLPSDNLLLTGLPFLGPRARTQRTGPIRRVLYADQPTVPNRQLERRYVYQRLVEYARAHPDREVILKPRHRLGEDTFHRMLHHPENLLAGVDRPPNFSLDYTPIDEVLDSVDLMITMSSTACLEALDRGCRVGLVLDLGVHERYGNQVFLDSGLLRTFDQLGADQLGRPDPAWLSSFFFDRDRTSTAIIADRAEQLLAAGVRPSHRVWESDYLRSAAEVHHATAAGHGGPRSLRRKPGPHSLAALRARIDRHGAVRGVLAQASVSLLPPVLNRPLRTLVKKQRDLIRYGSSR